MHRPQIFTHIFQLFLLLASSSPQPAHANKNREDLCGVSVHTTDFPDIGDFSIIDGTFTVPKVLLAENSRDEDIPFVTHGVALCCGNDCSTRLSAGMSAWPRLPSDLRSSTGDPTFQLSPVFPKLTLPGRHRFELNSSDTFWTRIEVKSPTQAIITFSKFQSPTSNLTVTVDIRIGMSGGKPELKIRTRGIFYDLQFETGPVSEYENAEQPALCGDSAWWYLSDVFGPGEETRRSSKGRLPRFSPVLVGSHGLQTTNKKSFPADLSLSNMARLWNMVRDTGGQTEEVCNAKGFVDTGMTMLHAPHAWGV